MHIKERENIACRIHMRKKRENRVSEERDEGKERGKRK